MKLLILSFILGCAELGVQSHRFGSRHDVDPFFSTFNVSGVSFQSIGLMTQPLLSCLSSKQKQLEENCRTISLSAIVPMGSHGGFGGRGHHFHRHSSFVSVFGECILTKLGAYDNSTSSVNLDTLATNLINNTTLTDEQKLLAIANLNLCYTNTTAGVGLYHHHEIINNVSRAIFCSSTALMQNGCATNTSGNSSAVSVAVAVSTQSLQMPIASYDGEASGEIKELHVHRVPECDEHGNLTESTTDDDSEISGYFDGYHAPRFLYRRRQPTRKPTFLCPNSTVSTTISTTTTEGNVDSTTTTISP